MLYQAGFYLEYNNPMTENLGRQLRAIRESREISLEEIAQKTHIRLEFLEALENGDTDQLPKGPQRKGFLRLYASELGLAFEGSELKEPQPAPEIQDESSPNIRSTDSGAQESSPMEHLPNETASINGATARPMPRQAAHEDQPPQGSYTTAQQAFTGVGRTLRQRRELLSLSIDDIHDHLHIRKNFLIAMEAGNFSQLTSPVQARGMLANYADFLNLDVDEILLHYADGLQLQRLEKTGEPSSQRPENAKTLSKTHLKIKNFFSLDLLVIAIFFIGFAAFVIWGANRIFGLNETSSAPTDLPEVSDVLLATGSPTPQGSNTPSDETVGQDQTETSAPEDPTPIFTPLPNDSPINLVIIPRQGAWVRVISDGEMVFEGRMLPGDAYDFTGQENLEILTGSAGALQVYFNEQDIGAPGLVGQVMNLIFTEDGLVLPTPTNTPTITETPDETLTPTPSPTPSQTLQPTATPIESDD
jgi:cytoskeleton protein RodZ